MGTGLWSRSRRALLGTAVGVLAAVIVAGGASAAELMVVKRSNGSGAPQPIRTAMVRRR